MTAMTADGMTAIPPFPDFREGMRRDGKDQLLLPIPKGIYIS